MLKRGRGRPRKIQSENSNYSDGRGKATAKTDEKVPCSDDLPEFFTFYKPDLCSERLRIPQDFVKKFGEDIPKTVTLSTSGSSLQVSINRTEDHFFFQQGWPEFVQENSLEEGEVVIFCYAGNSIFSVKVLSINGCRKLVDDTISRIHCTNPTENLKGYESSESENSNQNLATRRDLSRKRSIAGKSLSKNPSFTMVMGNEYINRGYLRIPKEFWSVHMRNGKKGTRNVTLWNKNQSWPVEMVIKREKIGFHKGWRSFVEDNSLRIRSVCTFRLITGNYDAFKVTVET